MTAHQRMCGCCGAVLPDGRLYTCNDVCEAALNEDVNAYIDAAKVRRHLAGGTEDYIRSRDVRGSWQVDYFALAAGLARDLVPGRRNGGVK